MPERLENIEKIQISYYEEELVKSIEQFIRKQLKKLSFQQKALFVSVFIAGFFSHGYALFNNLAYHDGILATDNLAATFNLGRWSLGFAEIIGKATIGIYSVPLFHGIVSFLFIALSGILLVEMVHIQHVISAIYIGIIMIVFPVVTSIFAYMYTSSYYWLGMFLCVFAVYIMYKRKTVIWLICSALLITVGLGLYQSFLAVAIAVAVVAVIAELLRDMNQPPLEILKKGIWYLGGLLAGLFGYLVANKIVIAFMGVGMSSYQGTDEMGRIKFSKMPSLVFSAYHYFINDLEWSGINGFKVMQMGCFFIILLTAFLGFVLIWRREGKTINRLIMTIGLFLFPLIVNISYLFSSSDNYKVHTLMRYSLVITFILPVIILEYTDWKSMFEKAGQAVLLIIMWIMPLCYCYIDNAAYLKMNFMQEQVSAYYTVLISEIKGTEGYRDDQKVMYIGERQINDMSVSKMLFFDRINMDGYAYQLTDLLNDYAWRIYLGRRCGFAPEVLTDLESIVNITEVDDMPCYPCQGSIKVVDDILVVKFSE